MYKNETEEHIPEHIWERVVDDTIDFDTYREVLEHTATCMYCADKMAHQIEMQLPLLPPAYLETEIKEKVRQANIQLHRGIRQTSKRIQLMLYSLKVGFVVAVSIFLLAFSPRLLGLDFNIPDRSPQEETIFNAADGQSPQEETIFDHVDHNVNAVTQKINQFTNKLFYGGEE